MRVTGKHSWLAGRTGTVDKAAETGTWWWVKIDDFPGSMAFRDDELEDE